MSVKIEIKENGYNLDIEDLITMGSRLNNSKRNFLFISKVLGKHIEVKPDICKAIGFLLASTIYGKNKYSDLLVNYIKDSEKYKEEVKIAMNNPFENNEKISVLGFAETATGLGMAVASAIENSYYLTTTRENISEINSMINFEEEHSHATNHKCFPLDSNNIINAEKIILVDDEITTGKSMINIIKELTKVTKVKKYTILTILDWRNEDHKKLYSELCKECNIEIEVLALITGDVTINDKSIFVDNDDIEISETLDVIELNALDKLELLNENTKKTYYKNSGRFGVSYKDIEDLEDKCSYIAKEIQKNIENKKKILVLGHGENIYIPSRVASYLLGEVYFKSTTRSPIYCSNKEGYEIKQKNIFYDEGVKYYFYNKDIIEKKYDVVILITENDLNKKLCDNLIIFKI